MDKRWHGVLRIVLSDLLEVEEVAEDDKEEEAHVNVTIIFLSDDTVLYYLVIFLLLYFQHPRRDNTSIVGQDNQKELLAHL